jgi:hypothetical protein
MPHLWVSGQARGIPAVVTGELSSQVLGGVIRGERTKVGGSVWAVPQGLGYRLGSLDSAPGLNAHGGPPGHTGLHGRLKS